jgi:hypothetical protein
VSIVEVTIALAIVMTILGGVSGAFLSSLSATQRAESLTRGSLFLETVMEDLSAQAYADLPAFDGNRVFDQGDEASSRFSVRLTVFQSEVDLLQVRALLTDLRSDRELARLTTFRSAR